MNYYYLFLIFFNCIDNSQKDYIPTEISRDEKKDGLGGLEYLKKQLYENNFKKGIISDDISEEELAIQKEFSLSVLKFINFFRTRPYEAYCYLLEIKDQIISEDVFYSCWNMKNNDTTSVNELNKNYIGVRKDSAKLLEELLFYLKDLSPMEPLEYNEVLTKSAILHKNNMIKYSGFDHKIPNMEGQDIPFKEISNRCEFFDKNNSYGECGENLSMSVVKNLNITKDNLIIFNVFLSLIIDDGVYGRGHREAIFKPEFKYLGFALGLSGLVLKKSSEPHNEKEKKYAEENLLPDNVFFGNKIIGVMNFCSDISPV